MSTLDRRTFIAASSITTAAVAATLQTPATAEAAPTTATAALTLHPSGTGLEVRSGGTPIAHVPAPLQVLAKVGDAPVETNGGYQKVTGSDGRRTGTGVLTTPAGSRYRFTDEWSVRDGEVRLDREVTVLHANTLQEMGFSSRLVVEPVDGELADHDVLLPGIRYGGSEGLPDGALCSDDTDSHSYVRETRLTLPLVTLRHRDTGRGFTLAHTDAARGRGPRTDDGGFLDERSGNWWIHPDLRYASLGYHQTPDFGAAVVYPAMEGRRTYLGGEWGRRSHPVQTGFQHRYSVSLRATTGDTFPAAARDAWRHTWRSFGVRPRKQLGPKALSSGLDLLDSLLADWNTKPGWPFRCTLPSGRPDAVSYVMGFIGQQAPAGYQLLRSGFRRRDEKLIARARAVIDFWVRESPESNGLPKLWIDGDKPNWRLWYPVFTRVAADGMDGVLDAARLMRSKGREVPAWNRYLTRFADFLVDHQGADGSFPRAWKYDGTVDKAEKTNTTHPIRFLTRMTEFTGEQKYLDAAIAAGEFALTELGGSMTYIGGTPDNPNVIDKEAGGMAMNAFLALHDAVDDAAAKKRWLAAAVRAADFTETWLMAWGWPIPNTPRPAYRREAGLGLSLIATGHSGVDNWLCYQSANFFELGRLTRDQHFIEVAKVLTSTSLRTTQLPGNDVGHDRAGLVEEAIGLADFTAYGSNVWLPWCTVAEIEPLAVLEDRHGTCDLDRIR